MKTLTPRDLRQIQFLQRYCPPFAWLVLWIHRRPVAGYFLAVVLIIVAWLLP